MQWQRGGTIDSHARTPSAKKTSTKVGWIIKGVLAVRIVLLASAATLALTLGLVACAPESEAAARTTTTTPTASATPSAPTPTPSPTTLGIETPATFRSVVDGDTIETSAGSVRIIGIDTAERGQCGHDEASAAIGRVLSPGDPITLVLPPGQNDRDRYDRLIRFVITDSGVDIGLMQIEQGHAVARYDSRDGYPRHPNEAAYHAAQTATLDANGTVVTAACAIAAPAPAPPPTEQTDSEAWWMQYTSCAKLKRNTVGHPIGPFNRDDPADAEIYQWFAFGTGNRGDGDGDGLACE